MAAEKADQINREFAAKRRGRSLNVRAHNIFIQRHPDFSQIVAKKYRRCEQNKPTGKTF